MDIVNTISAGNRPKIDPESIPQSTYEEGFRVLRVSITRALADPTLRSDYELFRADRAAWNAKHAGRKNSATVIP